MSEIKEEVEALTKTIIKTSVEIINDTLASNKKDNYAKSNPVLLASVIQTQASIYLQESLNNK